MISLLTMGMGGFEWKRNGETDFWGYIKDN